MLLHTAAQVLPTKCNRVAAYLDSAIIDQDIIHLEVRCLTGLISVVSKKGIAQAVAGLLVPDDVARCDVAEAAKDCLQVFLSGDWIQLGNEQHVGWRLGIGFRQITNHF